jgi:hypothetical protein
MLFQLSTFGLWQTTNVLTWRRSQRPDTILCHGLEFREHFVHEHVNIGKGIPRSGRPLCRPGGGSHILASML